MSIAAMLLAGEIGVLVGFLGALFWLGAKRRPLVVDYVVVEVDSCGYEISRRALVSAEETSWN